MTELFWPAAAALVRAAALSSVALLACGPGPARSKPPASPGFGFGGAGGLGVGVGGGRGVEEGLSAERRSRRPQAGLSVTCSRPLLGANLTPARRLNLSNL